MCPIIWQICQSTYFCLDTLIVVRCSLVMNTWFDARPNLDPPFRRWMDSSQLCSVSDLSRMSSARSSSRLGSCSFLISMIAHITLYQLARGPSRRILSFRHSLYSLLCYKMQYRRTQSLQVYLKRVFENATFTHGGSTKFLDYKSFVITAFRSFAVENDPPFRN
jgi:hypothetical protein